MREKTSLGETRGEFNNASALKSAHCTDVRLYTLRVKIGIARPANRDWVCQTERCHTLSNKTSLQ